jgi:hypothetical protein
MAAIYSTGGNRWNILGFNFTKRDALSSVYKISIHPVVNQPNKREEPGNEVEPTLGRCI